MHHNDDLCPNCVTDSRCNGPHEVPLTDTRAPLLTEVLTLSDDALVAFADFIRLNSPKFTRDPAIIRRVFTAYVTSDALVAAQIAPGGAQEAAQGTTDAEVDSDA